MRNVLPILTAAIILLTATSGCKKNTSGTNGSNSTPLIPESTGWTRVASVANTGLYVDQNTQCRMQGYDLVVNGNNLNILYSEDKFENGMYQSQYLKATLTAGSSNAPIIAPLTGAPYYIPNANRNIVSFRPLLNPQTLNMECMTFYNYYTDPYYYLELYDQSATLITRQNPYMDGTHVAKMLSNGDILAGQVNLSYICELDYFKRSTGQWTYMNQSAGDTQRAIAYTPFIINGGEPLAMRLYSLHNKAYLSIADFTLTASFPAAPYTARFTEEHPEYAPTNGVAIPPVYAAAVQVLTYTVQGSTLTVVLMEKNNTTSAYSLSAYQWTEGATAFTRLYSAVPISSDLGQTLSLHAEQAGCNPDGTAYALVQSNTNVYHLALVSAAGERSYGTASASGGTYAAFFSCLRSINGSYYALVTPFFSGADYVGQHMDVVKITP